MDTDSERLSPPRKRKPANLMRYPSATVISAHRKMRENSKKANKAIKVSPEVEDDPADVEAQTISDNKSSDTTNDNNISEIINDDNTKSNNDIANTNSDNVLVQETEIATNNNNKHTNSDNNNNEVTNFGSGNKPNESASLVTTHHQKALSPNENIDSVPTTMTAELQQQQPIDNTEFTNTQDSDLNQQSTNTKKAETPTLNEDIEALKGKTTPEKIAIEILLNIGDSLEYDDPDLNENALLMPVDRPPDIPIEPKGNIPTEPVNPELIQNSKSEPPTQPKGSDTDSTEILDPVQPENSADNKQVTSKVKKPTRKRNKKLRKAVKKHKRKQIMRATQRTNSKETNDAKPTKKGKLTTQTFVLKRGYKPKRKFYCVVGKCKRICDTRKELNNHHLTAHPRIVCDICSKLFDTPNSMHRHRYSHKKPKYFCADCGKGFFFESELTSHRRCHLKIPGFSCFAKNCDKSYKREAELIAHVATHKKKRIDCPVRTCSYFTYDRRNLTQHNRQHMPMKFECVYCYKKFRYYEQKKRHEPKCVSNPVKLSKKS